MKYVELRNFKGKTFKLKTFMRADKRIMADQKLPKDLRLWTDADYRSKSPQPSRLKTDSDGFNEDILPKNSKNRSDNLSKLNDNKVEGETATPDTAIVPNKAENIKLLELLRLVYVYLTKKNNYNIII